MTVCELRMAIGPLRLPQVLRRKSVYRLFALWIRLGKSPALGLVSRLCLVSRKASGGITARPELCAMDAVAKPEEANFPYAD